MAAGQRELSESLDLDARGESLRGLHGLHDRARGGVRARRPREPRARAPVRGAATRACMEDELLAESVAGELIDTEIEIRSGRGDQLRRGGRAPERAPGAPVRARRAPGHRARRDAGPTPGRATSTSRSSTPCTTTGCARSCAGSRSATTPGACTSTSGSAAPTARSPSATTCAGCCRRCSRSRPTRRSSTATTPACPRSAPRSSPAPSRAAGCTSRSATGRPTPTSSTLLAATETIVEATQLWWSVRPHHSFGTVEVRICDAQTRGEESFALAALIVALRRADRRSTTTRGASGRRSASARSRRTSGGRSATASTGPRSTSRPAR